MKPLVGVMPLWDDERKSIWMLPGYMDGIAQAGATPVIFPFSCDREELARLVRMCDGILFTGGQDVSPELYQETSIGNLVSCCRKRDEMETIVLQEALKNDKSVLGICRGIQFINAALGGTLYQDIPTQCPSEIEHHQKPPYHVPVHSVKIAVDSPLYTCLQVGELQVNSYHHQAVKTVSSALKVMAVSPDGIVEAVHKPDQHFVWAVQWHPEFSYQTDDNSRKIFHAFIQSMG